MRNAASECPHCADLADRIAWLESELGIQDQADLERRVSALLGHCPRFGRPQIAQVIVALYAAKGKVKSKWQLLEAIPSPRGNEDRDPKLLDVLVCRARHSFGRDTIETVWGRGYRLTPVGLARIAALLGETPVEAAA